ncbi:MAG TPA: hypothetical protein VH684_09885 [Xanthobacteraceae bacterium]|jgi:hypothetical protein
MRPNYQPFLTEAGRDADGQIYLPDLSWPELTQSGRHRQGGRLRHESSVAGAEDGKVHSLLVQAFHAADQRLDFQRDGVRIVVLVLPGDFDESVSHRALPDPAQKRTVIAIPSDCQRDVSPRIRKRWPRWAGLLIIAGAFAAGFYAGDTVLIPALDYLSPGIRSTLSRLPFASLAYSKSRSEMDRLAEAAAAAGPTESSRAASTLTLPDSYGLYVVSGGRLTRLESMHIRIPDARIAIAGLITKPGPVKLPDGHLSFLAYQRDLATNAPDTASVRIIAEVTRVLTFGTAGAPKITPLEDTWAMRAVSFDLEVAPVPESQEMMQLRFADPKLSLSPGRYMLVFNNQAYDFIVEGAVTNLAHCLERTETQNGSVYTQCRELPKPPELNLPLRLSHSVP